jgi:hypothetical protein
MKFLSLLKVIVPILVVTLFLASCKEAALSLPEGKDPTKSYLLVKNFSSQPIYAIYCTDSSSDTWGADLLGNELLVSGSEKEFTVEPGIKDIRVDTQATHGESKGAYQDSDVLFEANNTIELPLYDPES